MVQENKKRVSSFKGKKHSVESRLKMSLSRIGNKNCVGRVLSEETKRKISFSGKGRYVPKGRHSPHWKEEGSITALHRRIEQILGTPRVCEHCKTKNARIYDWAHKTHRYSMKLDEWMRLCRSCHRKYDNILSRNYSENSKNKYG